MAANRRIVAHDTVRFLLSQEWSAGERECVCVFWRLCIYDTVRFLPTQEWSCGGRGIVCGFGIVAGGLSPWRFLLPQEWSRGVRECIAQKYARLLPAQLPKYAADSPFPTRPFLRKQESHSAVHANIGKSAADSHSPHRPFLRRQESLFNRRQRRSI